jgi:hypothetical protein
MRRPSGEVVADKVASVPFVDACGLNSIAGDRPAPRLMNVVGSAGGAGRVTSGIQMLTPRYQ